MDVSINMKDPLMFLGFALGFLYTLYFFYFTWFRANEWVESNRKRRHKALSRTPWIIRVFYQPTLDVFNQFPSLEIWWSRIIISFAMVICVIGMIAAFGWIINRWSIKWEIIAWLIFRGIISDNEFARKGKIRIFSSYCSYWCSNYRNIRIFYKIATVVYCRCNEYIALDQIISIINVINKKMDIKLYSLSFVWYEPSAMAILGS